MPRYRMVLAKEDFKFSAAHFTLFADGRAELLHGHNYRVRVELAGERLDELGMVLDFADLKEMMQEILGPFDHRVINDIPPFDEKNTTAELFSEYVFQEVARRLADREDDRDRVRVVRVEVWENDTACAVFEP